MAALYPEDFQGAAPAGDDVIIISSDEDEFMDDLSMTSVLDFAIFVRRRGGRRGN